MAKILALTCLTATAGALRLRDSALLRLRGPLRPLRSRTKILMLMSDTGGGHRASANALAQALRRQRPGRADVEFLDIWTESGVFPWSSAPRAYQVLGDPELRARYDRGEPVE